MRIRSNSKFWCLLIITGLLILAGVQYAQSGSLIEMAKGGHIETAQKMIQSGADINEQDLEGMTALHHASRNGHNGTVGVLLKYGANPNIQDYSGNTALFYAERGGHIATANLIRFRPVGSQNVLLNVFNQGKWLFTIPLMLGFVFLLIPFIFGLFVLRMLLRRREALNLGREERSQLQQMWKVLDKMETRIGNLETILLKERAPEFESNPR